MKGATSSERPTGTEDVVGLVRRSFLTGTAIALPSIVMLVAVASKTGMAVGRSDARATPIGLEGRKRFH